ncbi:MAG: dehydrogenase [Pirellulaceae bacterium]|nr:dehydrogenase [Pirellulaceae bacterium]
MGLLTVFAVRPSYADEVITEPEQADSPVSQAVIEGESLHPHVTAGGTQPQPMSAFTQDQWSGDSQLWWLGARPGDRLTLELNVFRTIESIELSLTRARDYAIVQIELDGRPLGAPIDLYDTQVVTTGVLTLATPELTVGKHKLVFEIVGANPQAVKSYLFGLDFIRFRGARGRDGASGAQAGDKLVASVDSAEASPQPVAADEYPHQGLDAAAAAAAMRVPEGFQVSVCAAEPDVKQPIAMALDERGRTWIAEAYEYPQRAAGDQGRDRILVFEDTTGDGHFDSRKVFAEGLNLVSGLEVGFGGVWVGAAPYFMFIADADGDDKADGPPQILLDGWGYHDTHETLNSFNWGPDGWLYGCHGVFTHSKVGKPAAPDTERTPINAGVWRYHPLRHEFEVFAEGTSNPWGVDFNDHGDAFVTACVIPHLYHMIPGGRYQRQAGEHFNPYTYADIKTIADHLHYLGATPHSGNGKSDEAGGGHAHSGAMFYQGGAWPERYRDALFMNNIHGQRLNTDIMEPSGSGYVGHHGPDFLLTGDQASQILNMRYGPDGQVLFIDWYDMQACHRPDVEVHDRSNGRIYKVSYGKPKSEGVDLQQLDDLQLAELCLHENDWYVRTSRRLLQERAAQRKIGLPAIERLLDIALTHSDDRRRLRAMWARHAIGVYDQQLISQLIADDSPHVRGWLLRLVLEQQGDTARPEQLRALAELAAKDPSPIVRRAICSVVARLPLDVRWSIVEALASHSEDANDHNLPLLIWYAMEPLAELDPDRALDLGMRAGEQIPVLREFMLRRVGADGDAEAVARLLAGLDRVDTIDQQMAFLAALRTSLVGQRTVAKPASWDAVYAKLSNSSEIDIQIAAAGLGVTFGDSLAAQRLEIELADSSRPTASRIEALAALLAAKYDLVETLTSLLAKPDQPAALSEAAVRGLAQYDDARIGPALVAAYPSFSDSQRRAAIATLSARVAGATALLTAIGDGRIAASDLTADLARQMEVMGDSQVNALLLENWGQVRESGADKTAAMDEMKQLLAQRDLPKPDVRLGRAMYAKTCQRCHILFGEGEKLGPDLTGSNRANLDYLLENIIDPSAVMAHEYRQSIFMTEDGQVITGLLRSETEKAVRVQTAEALVVIPIDEIAERRTSEQSMMPDNQLQQFSPHEIRSLIAYLRGRDQVPLPTP